VYSRRRATGVTLVPVECGEASLQLADEVRCCLEHGVVPDEHLPVICLEHSSQLTHSPRVIVDAKVP
jgi:hypothetical protein